ncbi:hypothetical protein DL769_009191 [Monosporascus sp. CRB-8-3]|nr:hypothetical protein DL769_009191 [Monosporascus sp. CRB-8-3]
MMGNGRHEPRAVSDGDGADTMRLIILRGSLRNHAARPRLPALRDIEDTKADIVRRYTPDEVRALRSAAT